MIYHIGGAIYDMIIFLLTLGIEERIKKEGIARLKIRPGDSVLDWGCGTGLALRHVLPWLRGKGKVFAVDVSPYMLKTAVGRFAPSSQCELHYILRQGVTLPAYLQANVAVASFSLGVMTPGAYSDVVREISDHLEDNGKLLVIDQYLPPANTFWEHARNKAFCLIGSRVFNQDFSGQLLPTLIRYFATEHLEFYPSLLTFSWIGRKDVDRGPCVGKLSGNMASKGGTDEQH